MGLKQTNLILPEWAFLDANYKDGDLLEGRDVLLHVRTNTMLEFFKSDDTQIQLNSDVKQEVFCYKNKYGTIEHYVAAVHYSFAEFEELDQIFEKGIDFFCNWMDWMDKGIEQEDKTKHN